MFRRLQDHLQWRADLLLAGRYEDLSRAFLYPAAIYLDNHPMVIDTPDTLIGMAASLHTALRDRGVGRCRSTVTAVEMPRGGRFRVWTLWDEQANDPAHRRRANVVYYFRETGQGYRSEMLDVAPLGSSELRRDAPTARKLA